ncbi:MAG: hypothetical protein K2X77_02200 [Candidatus Obscuribacterales bacterium]|nr:hypothetical protein [Candidatus Obscuribacterales bacterium]
MRTLTFRNVLRNVCFAASLILATVGAGDLLQTAEARTPRQTVSDSLRNLQRHTDDLVKQVQAYLQSTGRWLPMPQGKDMQLCQALQSFQQSVNRAVNSNRSQPYNLVQADLQSVQMQSQSVQQLINQLGPAPNVSSVWMQVSSDILGLNSVLSVPAYSAANFYDTEGGAMPGGVFVPGAVPGFVVPGATVPGTLIPGSTVPGTVINGVVVPGTVVPGTVVPGAMVPGMYPGAGYAPGVIPYGYPTNVTITETSPFGSGFSGSGAFNPYANNQAGGGNYQGVLSNVSNAENQTDRMVKQLQSFLQMRAQWPPAQGSPQMLLCENMQSFQQLLRKFRSDVQSNVSYPILQGEVQQLATTSQSIDQLLQQSGATMDVVGRWNEIRTSMASMYQSFYSTSTGHYWMR